MSDYFLEIDTNKLTIDNLENYQLPVPIRKNATFSIIFSTEEEYCDYLIEIEKASTKSLAEYWVFKTPELIARNRYIVKVLTILQEARAQNIIRVNLK